MNRLAFFLVAMGFIGLACDKSEKIDTDKDASTPDSSLFMGESSDAAEETASSDQTCDDSSECEASDDPCSMNICVSGKCRPVARPEGSLLPESSQIEGDCMTLACGDDGDITIIPEPDDIPADDDDPCTDEICNGTESEHVLSPAGREFPDTAQISGDCKIVVCDEKGEPLIQTDESDVPPNEECSVGVCDGPNPEYEIAKVGTPCGDNMIFTNQSTLIP
jgi:hypothetical protein